MNLMEIFGLVELDAIKLAYDLLAMESPSEMINALKDNKTLTEAQKLTVAYNVGQYEALMNVELDSNRIIFLITAGAAIRKVRKMEKPDRDKIIEDQLNKRRMIDI